MVEVVGGIPLLDAPLVNDAHQVGDGKSLGLVVGDHNGAGALFLENVPYLQAEALAQLDIQVGKGFVHQQQHRFRGQSSCQCDPLLLATGYFVWVALGKALQIDQLQHPIDDFALLLAAVPAQTEGDILA